MSKGPSTTLDRIHKSFSSLPLFKGKSLLESDLDKVALSLEERGDEDGSQNPRLYSVLNKMDSLDLLSEFLAQKMSDIWFPFNEEILQSVIKVFSLREKFLETQGLVMTHETDLAYNDEKRHQHFKSGQDVPLIFVERLGTGASAIAERVRTKKGSQEFVRKIIWRGYTPEQNRKVFNDFQNEVKTLKRATHRHIVQVVASYTDDKALAIIATPVADCNLHEYLTERSHLSNRISSIRTFFGCLASAVQYLHSLSILHKDIKPQNILIQNHTVLLTDFGISTEWSEHDHSITTGLAQNTPKYCAPEIAKANERRFASDVWALGCVYLEIWTVLKGYSLAFLSQFLECVDAETSTYHLNHEAAMRWCRILEGMFDVTKDNPPAQWIKGMMNRDPNNRLRLNKLLNEIHQNDELLKFSSNCCNDKPQLRPALKPKPKIPGSSDRSGSNPPPYSPPPPPVGAGNDPEPNPYAQTNDEKFKAKADSNQNEETENVPKRFMQGVKKTTNAFKVETGKVVSSTGKKIQQEADKKVNKWEAKIQ